MKILLCLVVLAASLLTSCSSQQHGRSNRGADSHHRQILHHGTSRVAL